jgi:hypothetical protein
LSSLSTWLAKRGASDSSRTSFLSCSAVIVPRATPARTASAASTESWQVNALVEATPISGPASVGSVTSDSRAIVDSRTLTIAPIGMPALRQ